MSSATLYVPNGSKVLYESVLYWSDFTTIIDALPSNENDEAVVVIDNIICRLKDGVATVKTYVSSSGVGDFVIPTEVNYNNVDYPVVGIEDYAFSNCTTITSLDLSGNTNIESLGLYSFENCTSLISADISGCKSILNISNTTFLGCSSLKRLSLKDCSAIETIEYSSFSSLTELSVVDLTGCVALKEIEKNTFAYTAITSIDLSDCKELTGILQFAFNGCNKLETVDLRNCTQLDEIGGFSFNNCTSLKNFYIGCEVPIFYQMHSAAFFGVPLENATLYVPVGCVDVYKEASYWSDFGSIVENLAGDVELTVDNSVEFIRTGNGVIITGAESGATYQVYNISGSMVTTGVIGSDGINLDLSVRGVYIISINNQIIKFSY